MAQNTPRKIRHWVKGAVAQQEELVGLSTPLICISVLGPWPPTYVRPQRQHFDRDESREKPPDRLSNGRLELASHLSASSRRIYRRGTAPLIDARATMKIDMDVEKLSRSAPDSVTKKAIVLSNGQLWRV